MVEGWALLDEEGKIKQKSGIYKSKRSLLISYDLLPLRGLDQCEKLLVSNGWIPTKVEVVINNDSPQGFAPIVNGIPDIDMMDYGAFCKNKEASLWSLAIYLGDENAGRGRFGITESECAALWAYVIFDNAKVKGGTKKRAREVIDTTMTAILNRANIAIEGVSLRKCMNDDRDKR